MMLDGLCLLWTSVLPEQVLSLLDVCNDALASPPLEYLWVEMGVLILITKPCDWQYHTVFIPVALTHLFTISMQLYIKE